LIVDLAAPRYAARDPTQPDPTPPGMNSEQYEAVQRVLASQDYTLVLGMPGAGKTTTIVSMVQVRQAVGGSRR
jgi:DNA replication ATP-dependent helicase Dna2